MAVTSADLNFMNAKLPYFRERLQSPLLSRECALPLPNQITHILIHFQSINWEPLYFKTQQSLLPSDVRIDTKQFQKNVNSQFQIPQQIISQSLLVNFQSFCPFFLGIIEGVASHETVGDIIYRRLKLRLQPLFEKIIQEKVKQVVYGLKDQEFNSVWEVDKKMMDAMEGLFDLKAVRDNRKMCALFKQFKRSCKRFVDLCSGSEGQSKEAYEQFVKVLDDQRKLNNFRHKLGVKTEQPLLITDSIQNSVELQQVSKQQKTLNNSIKNKDWEQDKNDKKSREDEGHNAKKVKDDEQTKIERDITKKQVLRSTLDRFIVRRQETKLKYKKEAKQNSIFRQEEYPQLLRLINSNMELEKLRKQFSESNITKIQKAEFCGSVVMWNSSLEYNGYIQRYRQNVKLVEPYKEYEGMLYAEDSSVEFTEVCEEMCGEQCEEDEQMEVEESGEDSDQRFVVPDNFFSEAELSSDEESIVRQSCLQAGSAWVHNFHSPLEIERIALHNLIVLQNIPLPLIQYQTESSSLKLQLLLQIHGSYETRESLLRRLTPLFPSRSRLNAFIREFTYKAINQRLVKIEIIEQFFDQKQIFHQTKVKHDQQYQRGRQSQLEQHDKCLQKAILETQKLYITDLRKKLLQKGFKLSKKQIVKFVEARKGPEWDQVRSHICRIQNSVLKIKPPPNNESIIVSNILPFQELNNNAIFTGIVLQQKNLDA